MNNFNRRKKSLTGDEPNSNERVVLSLVYFLNTLKTISHRVRAHNYSHHGHSQTFEGRALSLG